MALMKPRNWLGYRVTLNEELSRYEAVLDAFETSEVPLDDSFAPPAKAGHHTRSVVLQLGRDVARERLLDVLDLLAAADQPVHFLMTSDEPLDRKHIVIGALNMGHHRAAPLTAALGVTLRQQPLTPQGLAALIATESLVTPMTTE